MAGMIRMSWRAICTHEEWLIVRTVCRVLGFSVGKEDIYEKEKHS